MHFSWDISLGQVIVTVPIMWVMVMLMKMYSLLLNFRIEHEDLMSDYAERKGFKLSDLPTRRRWW